MRLSSNWGHKALIMTSGGVGGFLGLFALVPELVVSTTLMLRSIAGIAQAHGENLNDVETCLQCLNVFAFGNDSTPLTANSHYYSARTTLARSVNVVTIEQTQKLLLEKAGSLQASLAARVAEGNLPKVVEKAIQTEMGERLSQALVKFAEQVATRFTPVVTEKFTLQAVPFIGAGVGAGINYIFIDHYQKMAQGPRM